MVPQSLTSAIWIRARSGKVGCVLGREAYLNSCIGLARLLLGQFPEQVLVLPMDLTGSGGDDLVLCSLFEDRWTVRVWVRD